MEKVIVKTNSQDIPDFSFTEYHFTEKEKTDLLFALKKFDQSKVEIFINKLAFICHQKISLREFPTVEEIKSYVKPMLNSFRKTLKYLQYLEHGSLNPGTKTYFYLYDKVGGKESSTPQDHSGKNDLAMMAWNAAGIAKDDLDLVISLVEDQIKNWTKKGGRPTAGNDNFCFSVAELYVECFNKTPTTNQDGPFFVIIKLSLEILGLPNADPSRMVRQAVKRLICK